MPSDVRNVWQPKAVFQPLFSSAVSFVILHIFMVANQPAAARATLISGAYHAASQSNSTKLKNEQLEAELKLSRPAWTMPKGAATWRAISAGTSRTTTAAVIPIIFCNCLYIAPETLKSMRPELPSSKQNSVPVGPRTVSPSFAMLCSIQIVKQTPAILDGCSVGPFE